MQTNRQKIIANSIDDSAFGTFAPDFSYTLPKPLVESLDPYEDLSGMIEGIFSDNRRVGDENRPYEF